MARATQDRKLVNVWNAMWQRCNNPSTINYGRYGAKGIKVCKRWNKFENFYADMGSSYKPGLTLDRIDNSKGYSPDNCRWVTMKENNNNKSTNRFITINGYTKTLTGWIEFYGLKPSTVKQRFYVYKWSIERALGIEEVQIG